MNRGQLLKREWSLGWRNSIILTAFLFTGKMAAVSRSPGRNCIKRGTRAYCATMLPCYCWHLRDLSFFSQDKLNFLGVRWGRPPSSNTHRATMACAMVSWWCVCSHYKNKTIWIGGNRESCVYTAETGVANAEPVCGRRNAWVDSFACFPPQNQCA